MKFPLLFVVIMFIASKPFQATACPFTITNDTNQHIIITDGNMKAIALAPNESSVIDPTIQGKLLGIIPWSMFVKEKLHVYLPTDAPNTFYKRYQLIEKYCSDKPEENAFAISDITALSPDFTKRFDVITYQVPAQPEPHEHNH